MHGKSTKMLALSKTSYGKRWNILMYADKSVAGVEID